ncbi:MAG: CDC27 family protein [Saprospiraceae bacterium]|nr:CDC27 family protein [Saprospiraceae bacterium]
MPIAGIVLLMLLLFLFYFSFDNKEPENKAPSEPTPDLLQPGSPNSSPPIVKTPDEVPQQENISPGSPIPSAQQLATLARKFYPKPDNWASGTRSGELSPAEQLVDSLYKQALAGFYQQRLKEAEKNAGAAFAADSSFVEALRLLAHIHFRQGKFKAASRDFEKMKTRYRSRAEEAEWNLLLCLYARYQEPAARKAFGQLIQKIINNTDHAYNHHAIEFREAVSQVTSTGINPPD